MRSLTTQISKHVNDIIQKYASGLFRNATLEFYGIKTAPIKELINPELPIVTVGGSSADVVFLLMDNDYLHFAFETGYSRAGLFKNAGYDLRLSERDGRQVHTVIIYTADVRQRPAGLSIGSLVYTPDIILMGNYDGNTIFAGLEAKIKAGEELTDVDILNLVLLPLMRHTMSRKDLAAKSIKLAQSITDTTKRNACVAAAFAFAGKYLDEADREKLLEVLRMTDLGVMLVSDAVNNEKKEIAITMLRDGVGISTISKYTGLDESTVKRLQQELISE